VNRKIIAYLEFGHSTKFQKFEVET